MPHHAHSLGYFLVKYSRRDNERLCILVTLGLCTDFGIHSGIPTTKKHRRIQSFLLYSFSRLELSSPLFFLIFFYSYLFDLYDLHDSMLLTAQTHFSIRMPEIANVGLTLITTTTTITTATTTIIKVPLVLH